jgi:uncharacterized protein YukJ
MPLRQYVVLVGEVLAHRVEASTSTPHFQIHARADATDYRVAVNVLSQQSPSELLYVVIEDFSHPMLAAAAALSDGVTSVPSTPAGVALDFIRGNLFDRSQLRSIPANAPGPDNDLGDLLELYAKRAEADSTARLYAFGERWGPESAVPDKVFGFSPGNGVHDIHMNQGNNGRFTVDDGVWQDGALLFHFPGPDQWVAIFLAFQSQAWHTDDITGHALPGTPGPIPGEGDPHRRIRIVAALVNAAGPAPEHETVTLLNPGADAVDLAAWELVDRDGHRLTVPSLTLAAGEAIRITAAEPIQLGNRGGTLTLLDADGLKVDGVAYTGDQADVDGASIVF